MCGKSHTGRQIGRMLTHVSERGHMFRRSQHVIEHKEALRLARGHYHFGILIGAILMLLSVASAVSSILAVSPANGIP
jgi:hypothetical protein